jgi:hypothetical protein
LEPYHPTTFQECGVAVPFTTPLLGGARARPTDRQRIEYVVPNPSGARGVYIMPWAGIVSLCPPTLHDTVLNQRIGALKNVTPTTIGLVAHEIAVEGLAGEEAMQAARLAMDREKAHRQVTNYQLLMILVDQVGGRFAPPPSAKGPGKPDLMTQARQTVDWISPRLGRSAAWTATALEDLSNVLTNIGVGPSGAAARVQRLLLLLRRVRTGMSEWSRTQQTEEQAEYGGVACSMADLVVALTEATLTHARALTNDMVQLLRTWAAEPQSVSQIAMRPEWLLDGWERICFIWDHAGDDAGRRAALVEIIGLLPVLPKEANGWIGIKSDIDPGFHFRRPASLTEDGRTGWNAFQLIARNEHFRAMTYSPPEIERARAETPPPLQSQTQTQEPASDAK